MAAPPIAMSAIARKETISNCKFEGDLLLLPGFDCARFPSGLHQGADQQKPDSHPGEPPRKHDHYNPEFLLCP